MKKHIKKKFIGQVQLNEEVETYLNSISKEKTSDKEETKNLISRTLKGDVVPYMSTDKGIFLKGFIMRVGGENKIFPEPDPVLIYFDTAYRNYVNINKCREAILKTASESESVMLNELMENELYEFFGTASSCIILLWTSLEALINRCIPITYEYHRITPRKTEVFNKRQIEESIPFDEKIKNVLPDITKKSYHTAHPKKFTPISNLKEFRNMIVHTREAENKTTYDYLFKKAFSFDYAAAFNAVKDFCNFYYKDSFIEECDCNINW